MPHASLTDFAEGGGLALDDVNARLSNFRFATKEEGISNYDGEFGDTPCLCFVGVIEDEDEEHEQVLSCGDKKDFRASKDGRSLELIGRASRMRKSCNAALFLRSLIDQGFPASDLVNDIGVLNGIVAHVVQQDVTELRNFHNNGSKQSDHPVTALIVDEIVTMPGEKRRPGKAGKSPAKAAKKGRPPRADSEPEEEEENDTDPLAEAVGEALLAALGEADEGVLRIKQIPGAIAKHLPAGVSKKAALKLSVDDTFLSDDAAIWTYDVEEETISLD